MRARTPDWTTPTSFRDRFADAVQILCGDKAPPPEFIDGWLDSGSDDHRLQDFAAEHGPFWAQGIVLLDAAHLMATTPVEGVEELNETEAA